MAAPIDIHPDTIPARLDALPWSRWHVRLTAALAITWLLDGLEGSMGGSLAGALKSSDGLSLTDAQLGLSSSFYLAGAVAGALVFGYLADRFGRKRLFLVTLALYLCATTATGLSWGLGSYTFFRVLTGAGIGGEYAAINSAVDELIPARVRGRVDLWINGTFWLGIIAGSLIAVAFLSPQLFGPALGWRLAFLAGAPIGIAVLVLRRRIPESPRWLLTHGRTVEADAIVASVEADIAGHAAAAPHAAPLSLDVLPHAHSSIMATLRTLLGPYRRRTMLCLALMTAQAFFYNSVFFSLTLVLLRHYGVSAARVGYCFLPIAITNFLGPVMLARFFDTVGRRQMISFTYAISGFLLIITGWLFHHSLLTTVTQVACWAVMFFFASGAASSAYLTVSELFPQEMRASAIAIFYAFGTLLGGVSGPFIFGHIVGSGSRGWLFAGYALGGVLMIAAGIAQAIWGVAAERLPLEALRMETAAQPLPSHG